MNLPAILVICGWAYACACRLSPNASDHGIAVGRACAIGLTASGIILELFVLSKK